MVMLSAVSFSSICRLLGANAYEFSVAPGKETPHGDVLSLCAPVIHRGEEGQAHEDQFGLMISRDDMRVRCTFPVQLNFGDPDRTPDDALDASSLRGEPCGINEKAYERHLREKFPSRSDLVEISLDSFAKILGEVDRQGHPYFLNAFNIETLGVNNRYLVPDFSDNVLIELAEVANDRCVARAYVRV